MTKLMGLFYSVNENGKCPQIYALSVLNSTNADYYNNYIPIGIKILKKKYMGLVPLYTLQVIYPPITKFLRRGTRILLIHQPRSIMERRQSSKEDRKG